MKIKEVLSPAEFEVFERIALLGETQKEIADRTFRSFLTVQTIVRNAYAKLGIRKATEAVLLYCAQAFDISEDITARQLEVLKDKAKSIISAVLVLFCLSGISLDFADDQYRLRRRARRRQEIELIEIKITASA